MWGASLFKTCNQEELLKGEDGEEGDWNGPWFSM